MFLLVPILCEDLNGPYISVQRCGICFADRQRATVGVHQDFSEIFLKLLTSRSAYVHALALKRTFEGKIGRLRNPMDPMDPMDHPMVYIDRYEP